jgi:hypothetical protein
MNIIYLYFFIFIIFKLIIIYRNFYLKSFIFIFNKFIYINNNFINFKFKFIKFNNMMRYNRIIIIFLILFYQIKKF